MRPGQRPAESMMPQNMQNRSGKFAALDDVLAPPSGTRQSGDRIAPAGQVTKPADWQRERFHHDALTFELRPEIAAGGYAHDDSSVEFYQRIVSVLPDDAIVLDLGAGSGSSTAPDYGPWRNWLMRLGDRCAKRIGVDIDRAVLGNPVLDEAVVIDSGKPLPFPAEAFDAVLCDWVLEHVEDAEAFFAEVHRVLKPGGWFCARTPNWLGYFCLGSRVVPAWTELTVLKYLQPTRQAADVFPKFYRVNSLAKIRCYLAPPQWQNASYRYNPTPVYHGDQRWLFRAISIWQSITPRFMSTIILVFARKSTPQGESAERPPDRGRGQARLAGG